MEKTIKIAKEQTVAIAKYIEKNPIEIYMDYQDSLGQLQIDAVLDGRAIEVMDDIVLSAGDYEDYSYYWNTLCEELDIDLEQLNLWLESDEGFYPGHDLSDREWNKLLSNTTVNIVGIAWQAEWNFYNWAYSGPVHYTDVKETLKLLGINPKDFHDKLRGGSATSGPGVLKGWFPDMPQRKPAVSIDELYDNMCSLYNGVTHFCFGDLAEIMEVVSSESKELVIKKGTNVVMYDRGNGAGITEVKLTEDITIRRKDIEFRNDTNNTYGVQACYGFVQSYWNEGSIQNAK